MSGRDDAPVVGALVIIFPENQNSTNRHLVGVITVSTDKHFVVLHDTHGKITFKKAEQNKPGYLGTWYKAQNVRKLCRVTPIGSQEEFDARRRLSTRTSLRAVKALQGHEVVW